MKLARIIIGLMAICAIGLSPSLSAQTESLSRWHLRYPKQWAADFLDVVTTGSRTVAVGTCGGVAMSTTGTSWQYTTVIDTEDFHGVTYAFDQFIAVGTAGIIYSSPDGLSWTVQTSGVTNNLRCVAASASSVGQIVVAGGDDGCLLTSTNGVNWVKRSTGTPGEIRYLCFGYDNLAPHFVAGAYNIGQPYTMLSSQDGMIWQATVLPSNNYFYRTLNGLVYGNGLFIFSGFGGVAVTRNGLTFLNGLELRGINIPTPGYGLHASGNTLVSWFSANEIRATFDGAPSTSISVINPPEIRYIPKKLIRAQGRWIGVGAAGRIFTSASLDLWTPRDASPLPLDKSVAYINGKFIAGTNGAPVVVESEDGVSWIAAQQGIIKPPVASDSGVRLILTNTPGTILRSEDENTWEEINTGNTNALTGVVFGKGVFVAVGNKGTLLFSTDARHWESVTLGTSSNFLGVYFEGGQFFAFGFYLFVSTDGRNWVRSTLDVSGGTQFVAHKDGTYLAIGPFNQIVTWSNDGFLWNIIYSARYGVGYVGAAAGNGTFVVVDDYGRLLQSDPIVRLQMDAAAPNQLTISAMANRSYQVEYADEISSALNWQPLTTLTLTNSIGTWRDGGATIPPSGHRFYRARLLP